MASFAKTSKGLPRRFAVEPVLPEDGPASLEVAHQTVVRKL